MLSGSVPVENSMQFFKKKKKRIELICDPTILLLGVYPGITQQAHSEGYMYTITAVIGTNS